MRQALTSHAVPEIVDPAASGPPPDTGLAGPEKALRRTTLLAGRRSLPAAVREREAALLAEGVLAACALVGVPAGATVCAYVPLRSEPGSVAMLESLRLSGRRVLLPVIPDVPDGARVPAGTASGGEDGALGWAAYLGPESLVAGPFGIRRPSGPDLGASAIGEATLVLVPALAVDRRGVRLGRGGGWYDRTLPSARSGTALLAVVRDEEVVDELPYEPHDVPVTGVVTPTAGPRRFPPRLD
jgi:5-formyltetrahydrofolate cyclo-ligase